MNRQRSSGSSGGDSDDDDFEQVMSSVCDDAVQHSTAWMRGREIVVPALFPDPGAGTRAQELAHLHGALWDASLGSDAAAVREQVWELFRRISTIQEEQAVLEVEESTQEEQQLQQATLLSARTSTIVRQGPTDLYSLCVRAEHVMVWEHRVYVWLCEDTAPHAVASAVGESLPDLQVGLVDVSQVPAGSPHGTLRFSDCSSAGAPHALYVGLTQQRAFVHQAQPGLSAMGCMDAMYELTEVNFVALPTVAAVASPFSPAGSVASSASSFSLTSSLSALDEDEDVHMEGVEGMEEMEEGGEPSDVDMNGSDVDMQGS